MADVTKKIKVEIEAILGNAGKNVDKLTDSIKDLKKTAKGTSSAMDMVSVAVGSFVGQLAVGTVTAFASAIGDIASQMVDLGTKTEKAISTISAMRNHVGNATDTYRTFTDVARNTNYNPDAIQQMGIQLLNLGFNAQESADLLNLCADASAGLGRGEEGARQLVDAISRIQATGELSSRQLMQLQMAGVNLDDVFSSIGMTSEQAMKSMQDGTLDSQKALDSLIGYMHKFDGAMKESKNNVSDLWGDVKTNVETAMGEIGASIFEAFNQSGILQTLIDATNDLVDLVRGNGCGAFSDLGAIASEVMDAINTGIQIVVTAIKFIILTLDECYSAFKSFANDVYNALQPVIDALAEMLGFIRSILSSVGKGFASEVNASWRKTFGVDPDDPGNQKVLNPRVMRSATRSGGSVGGGGGVSSAVSQLQKKIEALIEKYADAGKVARELTKQQIELAKVNLGMMSEEMKVTEEKKVKLDTLKLAHETLLAGLNEELEIAKQIADAGTRNNVINSINAQIDAENRLYDAKKKQVEFDDIRNQQKLKDSAYEDEMQHIQNLYNMQKIFSDQRIAMENNVLTQRKAQLEEMLADERLFGEEKVRIETQLAETIQKINENTINTFKGGWEQALKDLANQQINFKDNIMSVFNGIESGLVNLVTATGSAKDRFKNFLRDITNSILQAMTKIIVKGLITNAIMSAIGMGGKSDSVGSVNPSSWLNGFSGGSLYTPGGIGFASGGFIKGAGTSKSDSIPAMLSNGEYVLNASAVKRIGVPRLNAMNGFASGGYVGGYGSGNGNGTPNIKIDLHNETGVDMQAQQTGGKFDGESYIIGVVLNAVATNKLGMRTMLKGAT